MAVSAGPSLAQLLQSPRFEVLPLDGIEEEIREHLSTDVKVTVTASPRKGLEATLSLTECLAAAGYPVVPHLSARLVRDHAHLQGSSTVCTRRACASCSCRQATPPSPASTGVPRTCSRRWASTVRGSTGSASPAIRRATT